jgi:hypothetical protein
MQTLCDRWLEVVDRAEARLCALSDERASVHPAPGKWSVKEIIGHLIDSAANNHRRFVLAQLRDGLTFDGYEQDGWVRVQSYQEAPWPAVVSLWAAYNRHLIHVASGIPAEILTREQRDHNLQDIASRSVAKGEATTLGWFIEDYVFHLEHHLKQIF